jgi:hypothetical protein
MIPMKRNLLILPALTFGFILVSGCQPTPPSAGSPEAPAAAPTAAVSSPAPPVATESAPANTHPTAIRIKAGSSSALKDSAGNQWLGDTGFAGGDVIERPDQQIGNTTQPELYRSEHYSMDAFTQKLANGKYQVKLHFCETYEGITGPGERVFTFDVEGKTFKDFDVWAKAGGFAKAYVETVPVEITNGQLDIKFTPQVENPQINAIEIIPE